MKSHLINLEDFGVLDNDYDKFFEKELMLFIRN